MFCILT